LQSGGWRGLDSFIEDNTYAVLCSGTAFAAIFDDPEDGRYFLS